MRPQKNIHISAGFQPKGEEDACRARSLPSLSGSEAFLQSARLDLDKAGGTARQKTIDGSGGAASLLTGNWPETLRLTLDTLT